MVAWKKKGKKRRDGLIKISVLKKKKKVITSIKSQKLKAANGVLQRIMREGGTSTKKIKR